MHYQFGLRLANYTYHSSKCTTQLCRCDTAFSKSDLCRSEGACSSRPKSLLAVVETLRYAQGDNFHFCQPTLRKPWSLRRASNGEGALPDDTCTCAQVQVSNLLVTGRLLRRKERSSQRHDSLTRHLSQRITSSNAFRLPSPVVDNALMQIYP